MNPVLTQGFEAARPKVGGNHRVEQFANGSADNLDRLDLPAWWRVVLFGKLNVRQQEFRNRDERDRGSRRGPSLAGIAGNTVVADDLGAIGDEFSNDSPVELIGFDRAELAAVDVTSFDRDDSLPRSLVAAERGNANFRT